MRKLTAILVVLLVASAAALAADDFPKAQVFGGYSFQNFDAKSNLTGVDRQTFHGWDAEVQGNFNRYLGIVADIGGYYKTFTTSDILGVSLPGVEAKLRNHDFLFGPRVTFRGTKIEPFAHALFGVAHTSVSGSVLGTTVGDTSSNDFAFALGGGIDYNATRHFAIRPVKFDYLRVRISDSGITQNLNNYRYAGGIVFKF